MAWLPVITIALAFTCCIPQGHGSAAKKAIFKEEEMLRYFLETVTDYLESYGVIQRDQERDILESYEGIIASLQKNQKGNKIKHAVASKIAEIIIESVEENSDITYNLDGAIQATAAAFQDTIGSVDETFIETVRDMVAVMFNTDLEDEIEEETEKQNNAILQDINQENIAESNKVQEKTETITTTTTTEDFSTNEIQDTYFNTNTESNNYEQSNINSVSEENQPFSATLFTDDYFQEQPAASVSTQELITAISSNLASSEALKSITSGEISVADVISSTSQNLAEIYGLSQDTVQNILSQSLSAYGPGSLAEEIAQVLASATSDALIQSGVITAGQEQSVGQSVGSILSSALQQLLSQISRPAPAPAPRPLPAPRPAPVPFVAQQQTQQAASVSSASSAASTASTSQAVQTSSTSQFTAASSQASAAVSVSSQALQSAISSNLASSSALNAISAGQLSVQNVISVAAQILANSFGISQSSAQSILSQALSGYGRGSSAQAVSAALASASSQLLVQSGVVAPGQEQSVGQSVGSILASALQQLLSQISRPAPAPAPRPLPASRPAPVPFVAQQQTQQAASLSSATSAATTASSSQVMQSSSVSDYSSSIVGSQTSVSPEFSTALVAPSINSQELLSPVANARISSLRGALSSAFSGGNVDFQLLSNAIAKTSGEIQHSSNLSESEVIVEALLETIAALIELVSPSASASSSEFAYNLVQVFG